MHNPENVHICKPGAPGAEVAGTEEGVLSSVGDALQVGGTANTTDQGPCQVRGHTHIYNLFNIHSNFHTNTNYFTF